MVFINVEHERARAAFARFDEACRALGIQHRHHVKVKFVGVDISDRAALQKAIDKAVTGGAKALIAPNSTVTVEAMRRTHKVPVIFATHEDPVGLTIATSLAEPRSNLAGISFNLGVEPKMLEILREAAPGATRIGYIVDRTVANERQTVTFIDTMKGHGLEWKVVMVSSIGTLEGDLRAAGAVDAWVVSKVDLVEMQPDAFIAAVNATRRPAIYPSQREVREGGAMAYEAVFEDPLGALARQLDRVLSGVAPSEIPIERPKRFSFSINVASARAAGMRLTPELLSRADYVQ